MQEGAVVVGNEPLYTTELQRKAILGMISAMDPAFNTEDLCGICGIRHPRPEMLDMYPYCTICQSTLREPSVLRKRWERILPNQPLEVLMATFGDPFDCTKVIDVTEICRQLTLEYSPKDRIYIRGNVNLLDLFNNGEDFLPGKQKQLRIRYRMKKVFGYVTMDTTLNNRFPSGFILHAPVKRYLTIVSCTYGHPKGRAGTGRMSYDVTEKVQGLVDLNGGSYLLMSSNTPVARYFGDPCPGYVKDLFIMYDIDGHEGSVTQDEVNGFLRRKISIQESPVVSPLIFVVSASYGITPSGRRERLVTLTNKIRQIHAIEHRLKQGLVMQPEEVVLMKHKDRLIAERSYFRETECIFFDITEKMQRIVDAGRNALHLEKQVFDPNAQFGDPLKMNKRPASAQAAALPPNACNKLLEILLECQGHDSEKSTDSREITLSGYPRNFITGKTARFLIPIRDDPETGRGLLEESLHFSTQNSHPIIVISKALYGYLTDLSKVIDVTTEVQGLVKGRFLEIDRKLNLDKLFTNPCRGLRKQLKIDYLTRGFSGSIRVRERNDLLVATVELGYPPVPPRDDGADD